MRRTVCGVVSPRWLERTMAMATQMFALARHVCRFCAVLHIILTVLLTRSALAQSPFLVKDIGSLRESSNPNLFMGANGTAFFRADDGVNGIELWKSDGTEWGTTLVKDINPAGDSSPA